MRYNEQGRRLCSAELDTCPNLAISKGIKNGKRIYRSQCDRHRRPSHNSKGFVNPKSKQYIPLKNCQICGGVDSLERHRLYKAVGYYPKNIIVLCQPCHQYAHKFIELLSTKQWRLVRKYQLKKPRV